MVNVYVCLNIGPNVEKGMLKLSPYLAHSRLRCSRLKLYLSSKKKVTFCFCIYYALVIGIYVTRDFMKKVPLATCVH